MNNVFVQYLAISHPTLWKTSGRGVSLSRSQYGHNRVRIFSIPGLSLIGILVSGSYIGEIQQQKHYHR